MRKFKTAEEKAHKNKMTELFIELFASIMLCIGLVLLIAYGFQEVKRREYERNYYADYPPEASAIIKILEN